jgi:hypothetical protein
MLSGTEMGELTSIWKSLKGEAAALRLSSAMRKREQGASILGAQRGGEPHSADSGLQSLQMQGMRGRLGGRR